jgi:serine phosphatase RsbU (regulator of sigma subunit)
MFVCLGEQIDILEEESIPLGTSRNVRPLITEMAIEAGLIVVMYTDGLVHAGKRRGMPMDVGATIRSILEDQEPSPQMLADSLLAEAVSLDENRPADDISVLVLKVTALVGDNVRRMSVRLPLERFARLS